MILAWVIVGSFYVLASLGAKGHLPDRLGVFLTSIVAISLAMHVCVRFLAPTHHRFSYRSLRCSTASATWRSPDGTHKFAGYQALWFLISAGALVATLIIVRRVRDLDRYRYLTLLAAIGLLLLPLSRTSDKTSTEHACG